MNSEIIPSVAALEEESQSYSFWERCQKQGCVVRAIASAVGGQAKPRPKSMLSGLGNWMN